MSAGPMRITDDELAREVEALKSHRRLSVNRPVIDPDLPDLAATYGGGQELLSVPSPERERRGYSLVDDGAVPIRSPSSSSSSSLSPSKSYTNERARFTARRRGQGSDQSSVSEPTVSSPTHISPASASPSSDAFDSTVLASSPTSSSSPQSPKDPSHLFWVPASVHPEISPTDFRNFIKEHAARAVTQHAGEDDAAADDALSPIAVGESPIAQRLNSVRQQQQERQTQTSDARGALIGRSTSLSRRGSTLRRQYRPENDTDDGEDEKAPRPLQRNRSGLSRGTYGLSIPNLTIDDLQKLEAAAEEASQSQDPAMLHSVLRRTLSLNTTPDLDAIDAMPQEPIEDPDAPIIVPKPGQILRRAARTKMRKASGDSARGSLASRRRAPRSSTDTDSASPSEGSRAWELQHSNPEDMERRHSGQSEISSGADDDSSAGDSSSRPVSTEATDSIVDAYSRDSYQSDASQRTSVTSVIESTGSDTNTPAGAVGQIEPDSPSPPRTPTQGSYSALPSALPASDSTNRMVIASQAREKDATRQAQHAAMQVTDPLEAPKPDTNVAFNNQIKPVAVSHVPPVPAFEKKLPQQHQQKQVARPSSADDQSPYGPSSSIKPEAASAQTQPGQRRDVQHVPATKPQIAPIVTSQQQRQSQPHPPVHSPPPPASSSNKHKDKERKGAFGLSWFGLGKDDEDDRAKVEKESQRKREKHEKRERKEREREEKDKEESSSSSFLGALFGKRKGHDEPSHQAAPRPTNGQLTAGSLLERNEMGKHGAYFYSRYPIHIERAVYRLSHIKLANPRRPLYEQVLISNLMFWYLSIINRSNQGQYGAQSQQGPMQNNTAQQHLEQHGHGSNGQASGGGGVNGFSSASASHVDTSSAYDGMDTSSSSPDSEDGSSPEQQWSQSNSTSGGGNGAALKQKRNGLTKPNRAPAGANRGRAAETPMKQPGYGMQHRQIDDDLKTMGSHAGSLGGSTGFVVGQVVDVKALQANTLYRFVADPRSAEGPNDHDQVESATTDYLGLGNQFGSSEPFWSSGRAAEGELGGSTQTHGGQPGSGGSDGAQKVEGHRRTLGPSVHADEQKRSSSPNRPYRSEAEKERAWLGMRSSSGRASPTHGYGSISQHKAHDGTESNDVQQHAERAATESHPQGRSMSVGGIGAMSRTGDWGNHSHRADRSRKTSMGHMSSSSSSQGLVSSSSTSSTLSIGTIDEGENGYSMSSSSSAMALDYSGQRDYDSRAHSSRGSVIPNVQINLPIAPGSSAMLDAARTSQSRRR